MYSLTEKDNNNLTEKDKNKLLYFPLNKLSNKESIFLDPDKGIFTSKFKPIFTPILGKQLALNTYYQNDLIASAHTRISIELLQTFDRLKINFKVNSSEITDDEKNQSFRSAMEQMIQNKIAFMENIKQEEVPAIQGTVNQFINNALTKMNTTSFQNNYNKVQGYLELASSIITSEDKYIPTTVALQEMIRKEQKIFNLSRDAIGETIEHSLKTAWLSLIIATELDDFTEQDHKKLSIICITHDCGKAMIPKEIMYKRGRLTQLENDIIKSHVLLSFVLSSNNQKDLDFECFAIAMHHSKEDKNLPNSYGITTDSATSFHDYLTPKAQQKLKEIHDSTVKFYRLMSIVDTFEAISAKRVYKKGSSIGKTIEIMLNENINSNQFYTPYLDALILFVIKHFLPRNVIFKISDEILDHYYSDSDFLHMDRKFYQKNHRGVIVKTSHHLEEAVECVIFHFTSKNIERKIKVLPIHLLNNRYLD